MSDKILYKGETYGNTLGTNAALILRETPTRTEDGVDFYIKEVEGETKEVAIDGGSRATYGNLNGHTLVVQGLKMTFADGKSDVLRNGWINPSDLYTSFNIDVGFVNNPSINNLVLRHYEIVPYSRSTSETYWIVKNTKTTETYRYSSKRSVFDAQSYFNGTPDHGLFVASGYLPEWRMPSDGATPLLLTTYKYGEGSFDYPTTGGIWSASLSEIQVNNITPPGNSTSRLSNKIPYTNVGVYFLVTKVVPEGSLYTQVLDESNNTYSWSNEKYKYGYVLMIPHLISMFKTPYNKIAASQSEYNANPDKYVGYFLDDHWQIRISNSDFALDSGYIKDDATSTYTFFNTNGAYNTLSAGGIALTIPFANEAERDFALGMTENLQYLTKEEYERLP